MEKWVTFTVFTPTYNRAHLLPRAYESLQKQTFRDFEWLIIDDGSTDGTDALVQQWRQEADFPIRYYWQENRGLNAAINKGVEHAAGRIFVKLDSDDWLVLDALERMLRCWESIPTEARDSFVGIAGLCATPDGKIIGTPFPKDVMDANAVTIRTLHHVTGDKFGANRIEVLREYFPYPGNLGRYIPEALMWNRIARKYKIRFVNEVFAYIDYQSEGMSTTQAKKWLLYMPEVAPAMRLYYRELGELPPEWVPFKTRWRAYAEFVRYSFFARVGLLSQFRETLHKWLFVLAAPMGVANYLRSLYRIRNLVRQRD